MKKREKKQKRLEEGIAQFLSSLFVIISSNYLH